MSLTSNLKNKNSIIFQFFEDNFTTIDLFIKKENKLLSSLKTILPKNEVNYPWSHIGHITEYLLDLHIGIPIEELFPMKYLKVLSLDKYEEIKNMKINRNKISSQFNDISSILYQLSVIETGLRNNPKDIHIPSISALKLSYDCINDLHNIYHQSIIKNPLFNNNDNDFIYNPHFDVNLSKVIGGADGDLILNRIDEGFLIDLKTTKTPKLDKQNIYQLLGYVCLDLQNEYNLKTMGFYFPRQNHLVEYDIEKVIKEYSNLRNIEELRQKFTYCIFNALYSNTKKKNGF